MIQRSVLVLAVVAAAIPALGCQKKDPPPAPAAVVSAVAASSSGVKAAQGAGSASAASAAPGNDAAPPPPCKVLATTTVDRGARADAGLTLVRFSATQAAIGYAQGGTGTPKVMVIDAAGNATVNDVDWSHVRDREQPKAKTARVVNRVTPMGFKDGKIRAGMDVLDTPTDPKAPTRYIRCGAADEEPTVSDDTPLNFDNGIVEDDVAKLKAGPDGDSDIRDCRSFSNGESQWVLATEARRHGPGDDHGILVSWIIDEVPGAGMIKDPLVASQVIAPTAKKYPGYPTDHYLMPVSVNAGDAGYIVIAREGGLMVARRTDSFARTGGPWYLSLGGWPGLPTITHEGERVFLFVAEYQKTDIYGSTFLGNADPVKPDKIALKDSNPPTAGYRDAPAVSAQPDNDDVVLVFVDGRTAAKGGRTRITVLGADLQQKLSDIVDVSPPDVQVIETRVVALGSGKAFVASLDTTGTITGVTLSCTY